MGKGKGAGKSKTPVIDANGDIRPDNQTADIRSPTRLGDIVDYNTSRPVTPINDIRQHPDANLSAAIASMSFSGFDARRVCSALRISPTTLYEHYSDEFENGCSRMVNQISGSLAQRALAGSDTAAIFLLKTRGHGKFVERQTVDMNVEVTHKTELVNQLAGMITRGITIDAEPIEQKKGAD